MMTTLPQPCPVGTQSPGAETGSFLRGDTCPGLVFREGHLVEEVTASGLEGVSVTGGEGKTGGTACKSRRLGSEALAKGRHTGCGRKQGEGGKRFLISLQQWRAGRAGAG